MKDRQALSARAFSALPLAILYLLFCSLYFWQAAQRLTPTIFSDELELAQISRSIAETGEAARRGEPYGFQTIYTILLAPVWWIEDTESAFAAAKYVGVLLMTATIFPAYALARTVVSRPWALFAGAASVAIPGMTYAPFLLEEPLAYPFATAALWLIARFVAAPSVATLGPAAAVCVVGPFVRSQLAVLGAVLVLSLLAVGWQTGRMRRWRATWTRWDWTGAAVLMIGFLLGLSAFFGHASESWYVTTGFFKGRLLDYGLWAVGALALGIGILPLVGGIAALAVRSRGDRHVRAFAITAAGSFVCFGIYTAVKAAFLSTVYGTLVVERNLIYLAPLLFAGTALLLERPRARFWAVGAAGAFVLYLVLTTPFVQAYPYGDAPSLSMAALGNRELHWDAAAIEKALVVTLLAGLALLVARSLVRGRAGVMIGAFTAVALVSWTLTAEIYAAEGNNQSADQLFANLPQPPNWLDEATGGEPAIYLGQTIGDANGIWLLEFWNRSLKKVWSLDGSAPGPGPTLSPDLASPDGTLSPDPGVRWVVAENDVNLAARPVGRPRGSLQLYRLDGPLQVESSSSGILGDGWMGSTASYNRHAAPGTSGRGYAKIYLTNPFCAPGLRSNVTIRVGAIVIEDKQPALGRPRTVRRTVLESCNRAQTFLVPAQPPFRVELTVETTFAPSELDARSSDSRQLGAKPTFDFVPLP